MLSLNLHAQDICRTVPFLEERTVRGSFLRPYSHRFLEEFELRRPGASEQIFFIREKSHFLSSHTLSHGPTAGFPAAGALSFSELLEDLKAWPHDWLAAQFLRNGEHVRVELRAGPLGVAPLFLLARENRLLADWDVSRLYPYLSSSDPLDPREALRFLAAGGLSYGRRTAFAGIFCLTAGATAIWTPRGDGLRVVYPPPSRPPARSATDEVGDPVALLEGALEDCLQRRFGPTPTGVGAELSGGLDSALVATTMRGLTDAPLQTFGLLLPGTQQLAQQRRRGEVVKRFGLGDTRRDALDLLPLSQLSRRVLDGAMVPWEEFYYEAFDALLERARSLGVDTMLTGLGGDEIFSLRMDELPQPAQDRRGNDPAAAPSVTLPPYLTAAARTLIRSSQGREDLPPPSLLPRSGLESCLVGAAPMLRRGIWPVHPLLDPEVVSFCRRLPPRWRQDRAIERELLRRRGLSREVCRPSIEETFCPVMTAALRGSARPLLKRLFQGSRLARLGWVDDQAFLACYRAYCDGTVEVQEEDLDLEACIFTASTLEIALRVIEASSGAQDPLLRLLEESRHVHG